MLPHFALHYRFLAEMAEAPETVHKLLPVELPELQEVETEETVIYTITTGIRMHGKALTESLEKAEEFLK